MAPIRTLKKFWVRAAACPDSIRLPPRSRRPDEFVSLEYLLKKIVDPFFKLLEFLVVVCMVAMVVMVFGNVVLRYGFNSGIDISDEMSRYCFIWLTYIGAMVAMREKGHLGVDLSLIHI